MRDIDSGLIMHLSDHKLRLLDCKGTARSFDYKNEFPVVTKGEKDAGIC